MKSIEELMDDNIERFKDMGKLCKSLTRTINRNYSPGKEEKFLIEILKEYQCQDLFISDGIIFGNNQIDVIDMDMVEKMNVDIIEGYVTLLTSEDEIYIVDFVNERISKGR